VIGINRYMHIIYQTTNLINKKIYIGYHYQASDTTDNYLGSGSTLLKAITKYGKENFIRETLFVFEDELSALEKEREIVNEQFLSRPDVYNLTLGGGKPPPVVKGSTRDPEIGNKIRKSLLGIKHTEQRKQNMRNNAPDKFGAKNPCYGKLGSAHPAFGTKREILICPHCNINVPVNVAKRWHFDNCKSNSAKS
jgi:group I intron endonuclease